MALGWTAKTHGERLASRQKAFEGDLDSAKRAAERGLCREALMLLTDAAAMLGRIQVDAAASGQPARWATHLSAQFREARSAMARSCLRR